MELQYLNDHYAIPGVLSFSAAESGLLRAEVATVACSAEIYLQGAHLTAWQPAGAAPVIFVSERSAFGEGKAIRGGVPIVFPWFAARTATAENERTDGPSHGFARTSEWEVAFAAVAGDDLHLTLTLGPTEASRALGYDDFRLAFELVLGRELRMRLTVANLAATPLNFEEALHSYFHVSDAAAVALQGLAGAEYVDKTDGFQRKTQIEDPLRLRGETDRVYTSEAEVKLEDAGLQRRITVAKVNSRTTVVWNPWSALSETLADMADDGWRSMTCIETANVGGNAVTLAPGGVHTMEARMTVEALPS